MAPDAASALLDAVRAADRDRYLSVLYAPEASRAALAALYAFNAEIAAVRDRIREPLPGEIRLQWWRDVLEGRSPGGGHPVAAALLDVVERHELPAATLVAMLDARIFDLYDDPMPSTNDLEGYCGETASALVQLAAMVLDPQQAPTVAALSGHAGCAQAIAGLIRLLPLHRARGQCYVPADILAAAGTDAAGFRSAADPQAAARAVAAMAALGRHHLAAFAASAAGLPASLRPAFLPLAVVPGYLAAADRNPAAALAHSVGLPEWRRHTLFLRRALVGFGRS